MAHASPPASHTTTRPDSLPPEHDDAASNAPTSFVIIGADAYLAARPATPVQVAHACRAAGFAAAIPTAWGDELIAGACARKLATRTLPSAIFCACRRVRDRLLGPGPDLLPFLVSFVAPPVATARYLRALYGDAPLDITYVGGCQSASTDQAIDRQIRPDEFFASLAARGIVPAREPLVFSSMLAPDRRRCDSLPGGLPVDRLLLEPDPTADTRTESEQVAGALPIIPRSVVEIHEIEYAAELAQYLILSSPVLIDLAPRLGCVCSGAIAGAPFSEARAAVMGLEPPRSPTSILEPGIHVDVDLDPAIEDPGIMKLADVETGSAPRGDFSPPRGGPAVERERRG